MLQMLSEGPLPVALIAEQFAISAPAVSQHLKALRSSGLVDVAVDGQRRIYSLNRQALADMEDWLGRVRTAWANRLDSLAAALEEESGNG